MQRRRTLIVRALLTATEEPRAHARAWSSRQSRVSSEARTTGAPTPHSSRCHACVSCPAPPNTPLPTCVRGSGPWHSPPARRGCRAPLRPLRQAWTWAAAEGPALDPPQTLASREQPLTYDSQSLSPGSPVQGAVRFSREDVPSRPTSTCPFTSTQHLGTGRYLSSRPNLQPRDKAVGLGDLLRNVETPEPFELWGGPAAWGQGRRGQSKQLRRQKPSRAAPKDKTATRTGLEDPKREVH